MKQSGKYLSLIIILVLLNIDRYAGSYILLDSAQLATVKRSILDGSASSRTMIAYANLIEDANGILNKSNPTVMDKTIAPPTGDKHDYLSIGRYWWPNPDAPDGLPWIRKDGQTNPDTQTDAVDRRRLGTMISSVKTLSLVFYFSEDERYAQKVSSILHTWFLDERTRMNPHMQYGQSIPGYSEGRPYGILDARSIASVVPDAIALISDSPFWTASMNQGAKDWLSEYMTWLTESELGIQGSQLENNHGSWYNFQVASLAYYLGDTSLVKQIVKTTQESLEEQLDDHGGQIHELERTRSFFYSCFNLDALTDIANIGAKVGIDMWHFETDDKKSLSSAIDYLTPVIAGEAWIHPSQKGPDVSKLIPILIKISKNKKSEKYNLLFSKVLKQIITEENASGQMNRTLKELSLLNELKF